MLLLLFFLVGGSLAMAVLWSVYRALFGGGR